MSAKSYGMKSKARIIVILSSFAIGGIASATDYIWKAAVDGEISDGTKWNPEASPASTGDVLIWGKNPNPYGNTSFTVYLDANRSYDQINPKAGQVTFDLKGYTLSVGNWYALPEISLAVDDIWAGTTVSNGTLDVSGTLRFCYPGHGYACNVNVFGDNTIVNAKELVFGGLDSTMVVGDGAKINSLSTGSDTFFEGRGGRNTVIFTGEGTEYNMNGGLKLGNNAYTAGLEVEGLNQFVVEKGAVFNANAYIQVGHNQNSRNPTEILIRDGGVMNKSVFLNIGTWASESRMIVSGSDTKVVLTNAPIYICDQSTTNCQLVVTDHAKFEFHTAGHSDTDISVNGFGGGRLIVEDGAEFTIHNHYNNAQGAAGPYQDIWVGNRSGMGSDAKIIVRNGATWKVEGRSTLHIGCGDHGSELIVSNATFDAYTTDSDLYLACNGSSSTYKDWTVDTDATLRLQGDDAIVKFFSIRFGYAPSIVLEPGPNGFNQTPITLVKNVFWRNYDYEPTSTDEDPELVLDVTNWKPMSKGEKTLIQTDKTKWYWAKGTNAMKRLVANARVIPAARAAMFRVFLTDDLEALKVEYKSHAGLIILLR